MEIFNVGGNTVSIRADQQRNQEILYQIPAGRWASPSDLVGVIVFLASRAPDYMNGHTLAVDSGWVSPLILLANSQLTHSLE